jgi:hypothetical protein
MHSQYRIDKGFADFPSLYFSFLEGFRAVSCRQILNQCSSANLSFRNYLNLNINLDHKSCFSTFLRMNLNLLLVALLITSLSCASGGLLYRYNNITYESADKALAVQRADCDQLLSKITPTINPVGGVAVFISPSIKYIKDNFLTYNGPAISDEKKEEMYEYPAKSKLDVYRCDSEVIEKRRIFDKVIFLNNDNPESVSFSENIAILLSKKDGKGQYFIKRKNNPDDMIPIEEISTALPPVQRLNLWLDNIEKVARGK